MAEQEKGTSSETKQASKAAAKAAKPSIFARLGKRYRDLKSETRKIVWPTKSQVINNTIVVLVAILIVGVFIWILDSIFTLGVTTLIQQLAA